MTGSRRALIVLAVLFTAMLGLPGIGAVQQAAAQIAVAAQSSFARDLQEALARWQHETIAAMDEAGFGSCTNQYECSAVCPKGISHDFISKFNRDYLAATVRTTFKQAPAVTSGGGA